MKPIALDNFHAAPPPFVTAITLLVLGSAIAGMAGFDIVFNMITGGLPWLRSTLFAVMVVIGLLCAAKTGLMLPSHGLKHPILTASALGFLVAGAICFVDAVLFRALLPPAYVAIFSDRRLNERLLYFMLRSFNEDIFYRLFFMSLLVWSMGLVWRSTNGTIPNAAYWIAIVLAQAIPMFINEMPFYPSTTTPIFLLYVVVRFILAGILWGYLYWRHGFVTTEIAHVSTHIFLQPLLGNALA